MVLWSDEATFSRMCNLSSNVYRTGNSDPLDLCYACGTVKHSDSLMAWGCLSYSGVDELVVLPKDQYMNQFNHLEVLCVTHFKSVAPKLSYRMVHLAIPSVLLPSRLETVKCHFLMACLQIYQILIV